LPISARALLAGLALLKPRLQEGGNSNHDRVVIGPVKGNLHNPDKKEYDCL
jgi:hypothetical protein